MVVLLQVESYKHRRWSGVAGVVKVLLEWCWSGWSGARVARVVVLLVWSGCCNSSWLCWCWQPAAAGSLLLEHTCCCVVGHVLLC